jgi:tetratricopeptide (TPR) repeat protein
MLEPEPMTQTPEKPPLDPSRLLDVSRYERPRNPKARWRAILIGLAAVALLSWAFASCYRVLARPRLGGEPEEKAPSPSNLPASTGQYEHEKARSLLNAGRTLLRAGEFSGVETVEQVARLYPESPQARQALMVAAATYRYQMNRPDKAFAIYEQFVRTYPDDPQVPRAAAALRDLSAQLNVPDPTETLLRRALPKLADQPEAAARVQAELTRKK